MFLHLNPKEQKKFELFLYLECTTHYQWFITNCTLNNPRTLLKYQLLYQAKLVLPTTFGIFGINLNRALRYSSSP